LLFLNRLKTIENYEHIQSKIIYRQMDYKMIQLVNGVYRAWVSGNILYSRRIKDHSHSYRN